MMIKTLKTLLVAVAVIATASVVEASEPQAAAPNYELAERFSPKKMARLVPQTIVRPNWFEKSNKFWYSWQTVDMQPLVPAAALPQKPKVLLTYSLSLIMVVLPYARFTCIR